MIYSHKIRLNPTPAQADFFTRSTDAARFAYNWGLARWIEVYEAGGKPSANGLKREFNAVKLEQFPWVLEVSSRCTEWGFARLGRAFQGFFRRVTAGGEPPGYPRFKSRHEPRQSFYVANTEIRLNGHEMRIPRLGSAVNMAEVLRFDGKIMSAVISCDGPRWWVSVAVEVADVEPKPELQTVVGIDFGIRHLAVTSDGKFIENPRHLERMLRKLARLQQQLARQEQGSGHWLKTRRQINKLHYRIRCRREDTAHKLTTSLARQYDVVAVEDFDLRKLIKDGRWPRQLSDAGIGEIRRQLAYKLPRHGGVFITTPQYFPSNMICSACNADNGPIPPAVWEWACSSCGIINQRNLNSAANIRAAVLKQLNESGGRSSSPDT